MKAIALTPGTTDLRIIETAEPKITGVDEVKLKVLEVGICGTDRELVSGERALPPAGEKVLILGHEMISEVVEVGKGVKAFKVGDLAIVTVRRGCEACGACLADRPDMCYGGDYSERGIKQRHGFQTEYVVDKEQYLVKVPHSLSSCGVLCEPMSVVEKAIEEMLAIQKARLPDWSDLSNKQALVAGLGPIGLLACFVLRLRGFKVFGQDIVAKDSKRVKILEKIGGVYIDGRQTKPSEIQLKFGPIDFILEAVGRAELAFNLFEALGTNGGYVLTGVPDPHASFPFHGGRLMYDLVLKNQAALGSVNASKKHWQLAVEDMEKAQNKWGPVLSELITSRYPFDQFKEVFSKNAEGEIKCTIVWGKGR